MASFKRKNERMQSIAYSVISDLYQAHGDRIERIAVPVTDGRHIYQIPCNFNAAYTSDCKEVVKEFEKYIVLHTIYEQKGPLLVFKLESAKLWDAMIDDLNNRVASVLMRGQVPELQQPVQEAAPEERSQRYNEQKMDLDEQAQRSAAQRDSAKRQL